MLVLSRRPGQKIIINGNITILVMDYVYGDTGAQNVRLGIDAPKEVTVDREEVFQRKQLERLQGRNRAS